MRLVLMTGFPGFLGSELLPRILSRSPDHKAICLVQAKFRELAETRLAGIVWQHPATKDRIELVEGDITLAGLGLKALKTHRISEIYHLAAVYDLGVSRKVGMKINVEGTRHVLDFARNCHDLTRFHYVSTCYVSGRYSGTFHETDLDCGQQFNNHYEETKFLAEVEVHKYADEGKAVRIYRPSIVTGHSQTGATQKFDGPYYMLKLLMKQPRQAAVMPIFGEPRITRVNLVPSDFVTGAIAYLCELDDTNQRVYHLADPNPLTVHELADVCAKATGRRLLRVRMPLGPAKLSLRWIPGLSRLLGIPPAIVDYFVHPTDYATEATQQALVGSGISVPDVRIYLSRLLEYMQAHPDSTVGALR